MKTSILITIFILNFSISAKANMDCLWKSSMQGVSLNVAFPCRPIYVNYVDSILDKMLIGLNRKDTSVKILVLINTARLSIPGSEYANFISIGFDTLRGIDDDFITDYYFSKVGQIEKKFPKLSEPLDINSTASSNVNTIGIKIIYRIDSRLGKIKWDDIEKLIKYAAQNVDEIKREQRRFNVRYDANGWYVSLVTLDTNKISNILNIQAPSKTATDTPKKSNDSGNYWLLGLLGVVVLGFVLFRLRVFSK